MTTFDTRTLTPASALAIQSEAHGVPTPCFGLLCKHHTDCASYAAVEGSDPEGARMNSCGSGNERPMYVRLSERRSVK